MPPTKQTLKSYIVLSPRSEELAVILGVAYTLATDTIGMHRLQVRLFS